jgi:hypothetical protein
MLAHVVDCFAMGVGLVVALATPMVSAGAEHTHRAGLAMDGRVALLAVLTVWALSRVIVVVSARLSTRTSLAGAAATAAGFALMIAVG